MLRPPGIGIGLEAGPVFDRIIREERVTLQPGDTIMLYTDGLRRATPTTKNGARTASCKGSSRSPVARPKNCSSIYAPIYHAFLGREDAHDDLTCLVMQVA